MGSPAVTPPANGGEQTQQEPQQQTSGDQGQQQAPVDQHEENAVAKAYEKLRSSEAEAKQFKKENEALKPENENLKTENDQLKQQNAELQKSIQIGAAEGVARLKGFMDPEAAVAVLLHRGADLSERSKVERSLDEYAKEKGMQPGQPTPSSGGPINPQTGETPVGNAGMNSMIRRTAGRE